MVDIKGSMPERTERLFEAIAKGDELKDFVLVGGTALAIHLKHRTSEDLDFFINRNFINNDLKYKIDSLLLRLSEKHGLEWEKTVDDPDNICFDYSIDGVKVTFCANKANIIEHSEKYGHINIASIEQIAAMKMYTVLNHRIKARDFYDIKYIMLTQNKSFTDMLTIMQNQYGKVGVSEEVAYKRFLLFPRSPTDEGFDNISLKYDETFDTLRDFIDRNIKQLELEQESVVDLDKEALLNIINNTVGLSNTPVIMELYSCGKSDKIISFDLGRACDDLLRKNLSGVDIFSVVRDDAVMLDYLLSNMKEIPQTINIMPKDAGYMESQKTIDFHKLLNRCLEKSPDQIDKILEGKEVNREDFYKKLEEKREKFNIKGYEMKKDANVEYVEALMGVRELDGKEKTDILLGKDWVEVEDQAITRDKVLGVKEPERKAPSNDEMNM